MMLVCEKCERSVDECVGGWDVSVSGDVCVMGDGGVDLKVFEGFEVI